MAKQKGKEMLCDILNVFVALGTAFFSWLIILILFTAEIADTMHRNNRPNWQQQAIIWFPFVIIFILVLTFGNLKGNHSRRTMNPKQGICVNDKFQNEDLK